MGLFEVVQEWRSSNHSVPSTLENGGVEIKYGHGRKVSGLSKRWLVAAETVLDFVNGGKGWELGTRTSKSLCPPGQGVVINGGRS